MRISCPHCSEKVHTVPRVVEPDADKPVYAQCLNPECGWGGNLRVVVAHTSKEPRRESPPGSII